MRRVGGLWIKRAWNEEEKREDLWYEGTVRISGVSVKLRMRHNREKKGKSGPDLVLFAGDEVAVEKRVRVKTEETKPLVVRRRA